MHPEQVHTAIRENPNRLLSLYRADFPPPEAADIPGKVRRWGKFPVATRTGHMHLQHSERMFAS
jgi:hypothetical protein